MKAETTVLVREAKNQFCDEIKELTRTNTKNNTGLYYKDVRRISDKELKPEFDTHELFPGETE